MNICICCLPLTLSHRSKEVCAPRQSCLFCESSAQASPLTWNMWDLNIRYLSTTPSLKSSGEGAGEREGERGTGVKSRSSPLGTRRYSLVWGVGNKPARVFNTEEKPLLVAMAGGGGGRGEVDKHGGEQQVGQGDPHRQLQAPRPTRPNPQHLDIGSY